ncbi:MAG: acyl carrier protein [Ignavibacteriae bacterium]|nr:acyl carrier protein [Ignavibacteriota bacterium]
MISDKIRNFLSESDDFSSRMNPGIKDEESLIDTGVVDSFGIVSLIAFLEEAFNIKIESEDFVQRNFETVVNMVNFVKRKQEL